MPNIARWQSVDPPYAELLVLKEGQSHDRLISLITLPAGVVVKTIRGGKCKTKESLLSEFARVLEFPSYFGQNWDALEDCLADLQWLPAAGYLLIMTEAEQVLRRHQEDYRTFLSIIRQTGKEWAAPRAGEWPRPALPFHVLFTVAQDQQSKRKGWDLPLVKESFLDGGAAHD